MLVVLIAALSVLLAAGAALGATGAIVDLTTLGGSATVNSAVLEVSDFTGSTGTGVFDSFVRIQNEGTEQGYNTSGRPVQYDEDTSGFTRDLPLNQVPVVSVGGTLYREFRFDVNQSNSAGLLPVEKIKLFISQTAGIHSGANPDGAGFGVGATLVWDLDGAGDRYVLLDSNLFPGSGKGDMRLLVPVSSFPSAANTACPYNGFDGASCGYYLYLYTLAGDTTNPANDGFEEWSVRKAAYLTVTKTATTSFTRTFPWTIDKSVTPSSWNLFRGDSGASRYTVALTKGAPVDSAWAVSGTITISNPSGSAASIASVTDVISGVAGPVTPSCGVTFPYTLPAGNALSCTYSSALPDGTGRTNTATATLSDGGAFTGTATLTFGTPTTVVNDTVNVTDTNGGAWAFSASGSQVYSRSFSCDTDAGTHNNTATITETDQSDGASVTVTCNALTVTKDASASYTRTFPWTIDKSVTPSSWNLFRGDSGTSRYTVALTKGTAVDSAWAVAGAIHVQNSASIAATLTGVADVLTGPVTGSVSCGVTFPYTLAAGATLDCTYTASLADATSRTNTATATLQNHSYTYLLAATNTGTTDFTGTATLTFGTPTTVVNDTVNVTDTNGGAWAFSASGSQVYSKSFSCDTDAGTHNNTATITETDQSDGASVTVTCNALTVTKDAATSLTRTYDWTIAKSSSDPTVLLLNPGETYLYHYSITVGLNGAPVDSAWAVAGAIHVQNSASIAATLTGVADVLTGPVTGSVSCGVTFPYTLAAGATLDCTYTASLADATSRTNTATATLQNHSYTYLLAATNTGTTDFTGTAAVSFTGATISSIDECVTVTDSLQGTLGTLCAGENTLPHTYSYTRTFGPYTSAQCGENLVDNTGTCTTNDTTTADTSSWRVTVNVPCPTGCTLTQGYWKTHSIYGPAPADPHWLSNGAFTPDTTFFSSGQTYLEVLKTAPKGGNAYYILAHQYIAAKLNLLSPAASTSEVDAAIAYAETFFAAHAPGDNLSKAERAAAIAAAGLLGSYNEGLIGPGHCSEDTIARTANHD